MRWLSNLRLLDQDCVLCAGTSQAGIVCLGCQNQLTPAPQPACPCCALATLGGGRCGQCLANLPQYDATVAAYTYAHPADSLIHRLKYRNGITVAPLLAEKLRQSIELRRRRMPEEPLPDLLLAMPLHPSRWRERGYNQSLLLAKPLAKAFRIPLADGDAVARSRATTPQADLPWKERARNIKGAFRVEAFLAGKHIAVVDDVMTTGATLEELAGALKAAGAARVTNWVVARTLQKGD